MPSTASSTTHLFTITCLKLRSAQLLSLSRSHASRESAQLLLSAPPNLSMTPTCQPHYSSRADLSAFQVFHDHMPVKASSTTQLILVLIRSKDFHDDNSHLASSITQSFMITCRLGPAQLLNSSRSHASLERHHWPSTETSRSTTFTR